MLTEREVSEIRSGLKEGLRGPVLTKWAESLLRDRDERIKRDREIAARLVELGRLVEGV